MQEKFSRLGLYYTWALKLYFQGYRMVIVRSWSL